MASPLHTRDSPEGTALNAFTLLEIGIRRLERFRSDRPLAHLVAKGSDVHVDGANEDECVATEGGVDQLGTIERSAGLANQCIQQPKLALGKFNRFIVDHSSIAATIDGDVQYRNDVSGCIDMVLRPSAQRLEPLEQNRTLNGLTT